MTKPIGVKNDSNYGDGSGSSVVRYAIPLSSQLASAASVVATLYNRSIPPYYLRQRGEKCFGKRYGPVEKYSVLPERDEPIRRYLIGSCKIAKASAAISGGSSHIMPKPRSLISVARSWSARPHSVLKTLTGEDHLKHRSFDTKGGGNITRSKPTNASCNEAQTQRGSRCFIPLMPSAFPSESISKRLRQNLRCYHAWLLS